MALAIVTPVPRRHVWHPRTLCAPCSRWSTPRGRCRIKTSRYSSQGSCKSLLLILQKLAPLVKRVLRPLESAFSEIPCDVFVTWILPHLDPISIFNLYNSSRILRRVIPPPSLSKHKFWNLAKGVASFCYSAGGDTNPHSAQYTLYDGLVRGIPTGWIQLLKAFSTTNSIGRYCTKATCQNIAFFNSKFRTTMCSACLADHLIR
jgi:hypothetical protein